MPKLSDRIKELRKSVNMTQEEFGQKFGVVKSTVSLYESGKSTPNDELKKKICEYFNISLDYLLGRTDKKEGYLHDSFSETPDSDRGFFFFFFDCWKDCLFRIKDCLQELNISEEDFCAELNVDLNKKISISDLKSIANKLEVSTDYLLGVSDIKNIASADTLFTQSLSEREKDIIESFRLLNKDNQDIIVGELKKCLKEQRHESVAADELLKKADMGNLGKSLPSSGTEGVKVG